MIVGYLKQGDNMDGYALYELFEDARSDIFQLMNFAFVRFKNTNPFHDIAMELVNVNNV